MKYIFRLFSIILIFSFFSTSLLINEIEIHSSRPWCWTKPSINDPAFILNPNNGGYNWGYCKQGVVNTSKKKEYLVYVTTSSLPLSDTKSKITISFMGTDSVSPEYTLSQTGFKLGTLQKIRIFAEDVGNLQSIKLIIKGNDSFLCSTIRIESDMNYWMFECMQTLQCPKTCHADLTVTDMENYDINVKTSFLDNSGTSLPVYIVLWGNTKKSPKKLLSDKGFSTGSLVQSAISSLDVGSVYAISLYINGDDMWRPEEIIVSYLNSAGETTEVVFRNIGNAVVASLEKGLTIKVNNPSEISDVNDANENNSSILDKADQQRIIKLSCSDFLKDNENFGPSYGTSNVNYMMFLASCPYDCMREPQKAVGLGIHPEESSICVNAMIDKAISFYGGIISINIFRGLPTYTGGQKIFGIPVEGSGQSKRSYTIAKVDNLDMIAMDVRILDSEGKSSFKGRPDIRYQGVWGTICAVGLDDSAAKIICKQIGYKEGKFLNPVETNGRGFCGNYEGVNYCGVTSSPILFSNISCQGNEDSIMDCYRKLADRTFCTHQYDAIIECGYTDTDEYVSYDANTLRLMDSSNNPTTTGIGRLEILKGSWGSVCNFKFSESSAQVACRQMGYLEGSMYGESNSSNMCMNVLGNNLCGDFSLPIKLTEVVCNGHEKFMKECKSSSHTVSCSQFNNVIIKCEGFGDSSGKSQNIKKTKVLNPLIRKLPMPPTYNAKCESTAKNVFFRGDPGSIFLVNCPSDCMSTNISIIGTGVYTIDSSICRAAIHSGVITNEGGNFALVKGYGQNKYYSNSLRNISSLETSYAKVSFSIAASNLGYSRLISMFNNASFLQLKSKLRLSNISHFSGTNNLQLYSSFLETKTVSSISDIKAFYEWSIPSNDFSFDGSITYVDLFLVDLAKSLLELKTFTIYFKIQMQDLKDKTSQTIFSIGGCEGMSITVDSNSELIVDIKCGSIVYKSGIYIPINYQLNLGITYDGLKIAFYLNGEKGNEINTYFNLHFKQKICVGKSSEYNIDYFSGKIFFIAFFNEAFGPHSNKKLFTIGYIKPDQIKAAKFLTLDNRECISSCANQPIPGFPGSPTPPSEAITYEINGELTVLTTPGVKTELGDTQNLSPYIEVKCTTTARELFNDKIKIGDKKRVKCPNDCNKDLIYGTIVYSFDSSICISSIHSGVRKISESKMILIKALPGMNFYQGTLQHNVQSTSIDKCDYSFSTEEAPQVISVECDTTGNLKEFSGTLGTKYLVRCPTNCSKVSHNVFGNNLYSGDSSICQSAIHSGAMNDRGGEVQFIIDAGQKLYFSLRAFGIESKERQSYVKSIKFLTANNNLFVKFKEEYKTEFITTNWDIIDSLDANSYPSKWAYVKTPENIQTSSKFLIHQSHSTKSLKPLSYGTILLLKNSDVVNSMYVISLYVVDLSPVGIIFRYKDDNNYYHLRMNNIGSYKLCLIKKMDGKSTILSHTNISVNPKIWYSFTLLIFHDKFKVFVQIGDLRNNQLILDVMDNDIQRGSIGIASDGNEDFYVNGIFIDNYVLNKNNSKSKDESNRRSFEIILKENTEIHRKKYCKAHDMENFSKCLSSHYYCKIRCDEMISNRENILNYSCFKLCIHDAMITTKIQNLEFNQDVAYGLNSDVWSPKEREKCDYRPDNNGIASSWIPGYITEVKSDPNDPEQKTVKLKYKNKDQKLDVTTILYPSINLKKCGAMLKVRDDCSKSSNEVPDPGENF